MPLPAQFMPSALSLIAVFAWGVSDFLGGYASRRGNPFVVACVVNGGGLILMALFARAIHSQVPPSHNMEWAMAGGAIGGTGLAIFYGALAKGKMGLTAPIAALLGAAIPTAFGMITEGLPPALNILGFILAGIGIWLISRNEGGGSDGIGLAALAGIGFSGFYLCMREAGNGSALWLAASSRTGGLLATATVVLFRRNFFDISSESAAWGFLGGILDVTGTALFVRAAQIGRLDAAVVLTSLYPAITVLLARIVLKEHFTRWKAIGMLAALLAVPLVAGK